MGGWCLDGPSDRPDHCSGLSSEPIPLPARPVRPTLAGAAISESATLGGLPSEVQQQILACFPPGMRWPWGTPVGCGPRRWERRLHVGGALCACLEETFRRVSGRLGFFPPEAALRRVRFLELSESGFDHAALRFLSAQQLQGLRLKGCLGLNDEDLDFEDDDFFSFFRVQLPQLLMLERVGVGL